MAIGTFLSAALRHPAVVGAIGPSSRHLAADIVRRLDARPGQLVVELGSGTGPMTRALASVLPGLPRFAVEALPEMAAATRRAAPGVEVVEGSAAELPRFLAERGLGRAEGIVSGLPFAAWPERLQQEVLDGVLAALTPDGRMVTFTYVTSAWLPAARRFRRLLERSFARVTRGATVWANLPPAFVYVCDGPIASGGRR
ncbi:MAG: class I SAM-dependent methyltransferase [Planctomycetaceae bacterium]